MADSTITNEQIKANLDKVNTKVLGDLPEKAKGNLFTTVSEQLANAAHNATHNQQESNTTQQSSTVEGVTTIYTLDAAADGVATSKHPGHQKND